jgi:hypothetical protein
VRLVRGAVVRAVLIGWAALALFAAPAAAAPMTTPGPYVPGGFSQGFTTEYSPNIVNLWTNKPLSITAPGGFNGFGAGTLPSGWTYYQNDVTGGFVQLVSTAPSPSGTPNFTWTQFFSGSRAPGGWSMDWQEISYDFNTGGILASHQGNLRSTGSGWTVGTYGAANGGLGLVGPVPEPGTFLLVGLGAAALLFVARRRAVAAALVPVVTGAAPPP